MKKETAVEWLIDELRKVLIENGRLDAISISQLKMKAKAMEKAQIIRAFCEGYDHDGDNYDRAEIKYYEKTYGQ